jgi:N-acetylglucosaminyl-diphospho-decaprenol L-rhamnosyltransferase
VGALLVHYRAPRLVASVVESLAAAGIPAVVADNSGELRGAPFSVVDCGGNVGFGAGCNRAAEALGPGIDTICLHNPDVVPDPAAVVRLAGHLGPGRAAVAPAVRTDGLVRTRGFHVPGVAREAWVARRATRPAPRAGEAPRDRAVGGRGRRFGTAALLVVDRGAFAAVGGFDERYFLYGEDLDLWVRLQRAGAAPGFAPDVVVEHRAKSGSEMDAGTRELLRRLGVELFAELHRRTGWRPLRAVHRLAGPPEADPDLVALVEEQWRSGAAPSAVLGAVRAHLAVATGRPPIPEVSPNGR